MPTTTNVTINQPTGAGSGVLGRSRTGLWRGQAINIIAQNGVKWIWEVLYAPPDSALVLGGETFTNTLTFTPDVRGTWRIQLTIDDGAASVVFLVSVSKNESGVNLYRGWRQFAFAERAGEANFTGVAKGNQPELDDIFKEIATSLDAGGGGGSGGGSIVYRPAGAVTGSFYDDFADAVTAAQDLPGEVTLVLDGSLDVVTLPAGNFDLERRIRLVALGINGTELPLAVEVADGCVLENPVYIEGVNFDGSVFTQAPLVTTDGTAHRLTFVGCTYNEDVNSVDFVEMGMGAGNTTLRMVRSTFTSNTHALCTVGGARVLDVTVEEGDLGATTLRGESGTINARQGPGGVIGAQGSFTGTLNRTSTLLDDLLANTSTLDLNNKRVTGGADAVGPTDLVTKQQLDAMAQGLDFKESVRLASTANVAVLAGNQTIDGVLTATNDRVLLKNQLDPTLNGIWTANTGLLGAWQRATDFDSISDVTSGAYCFVSEGTVNGDSGWVLTTNDPITIGVTSLTFVQMTGAGQIIAGTGVVKTGNTLSLDFGLVGDIKPVAGAAVAGASGKAADAEHVHAREASTAVIGEIVVDVSAASPITLVGGQHEAHLLVFTGSPAGDVLVNLPATDGREWALYNNLGDPTKVLEVRCTGGSQRRKVVDTTVSHVVVVDGELESDDDHSPVRWVGVAGAQSTDQITWTTVGAIYFDPTTLPIGDSGSVRLTGIFEAVGSGVVVDARLIDDTLTVLTGSEINSTSTAETFPEKISSGVIDWGDLGLAGKVFAVQIKRAGGVGGDRAICHQAFLEVRWDLWPTYTS